MYKKKRVLYHYVTRTVLTTDKHQRKAIRKSGRANVTSTLVYDPWVRRLRKGGKCVKRTLFLSRHLDPAESCTHTVCINGNSELRSNKIYVVTPFQKMFPYCIVLAHENRYPRTPTYIVYLPRAYTYVIYSCTSIPFLWCIQHHVSAIAQS